jgi:hypothetical protein
MNNNFTHKELKNFKPRFSNFYTMLTSLPAGPWFAVNFLLAQFNRLLNLTDNFEFFNGNKPALKLMPVVIGNLYNLKKANQHSL